MAETPADGDADATARLAALRASGADRRDPVRFAYLEALARRAADQAAAIRQPLIAKILAESEALAARHRQAPAAAEQVIHGAASSPLADLLAYIGQHAVTPPRANSPATAAAHAAPHPKPEIRPAAAPELKSVAYFRNTWSKLSTEQQLTQTLAQAPENAGPMNSQHLVLRALQLMRDRSPDYLEGFMSYVDTLIWLEQASPARPNPGRSPTGEGEKKAKKTRRGSGQR